MYKPIAMNDIGKISALTKLYKKIYKYIGLLIIILSIIMLPLLPYFIDDFFSYQNITLYYFIFIINTTISYFFIYKRTLIIAHQKKYIEVVYHYIVFISMSVVQIVFLLVFKEYLIFLLVNTLGVIIENILISRKADLLFKDIFDNDSTLIDENTKKDIKKNVIAMIGHKFGAIVVNGTDNLLLSKFVGLISVGIYANYYLILRALSGIYSVIFQSITASVGNLGVEDNNELKLKTFFTLNFIVFYIYGFSAVALYILINPFISLWIGKEFLFNEYIVLAIVFNFYVTGMRHSVLTFREALGLYWKDRFKPIFEAVINLVASIFLAINFGVIGIIVGTSISTLLTCFWVEPKVLFKYGLNSNVKTYFIKYLIYTSVLIFSIYVILLVLSFISLKSDILFFIVKMIVVSIITNFVFILFLHKTKEFKNTLKLVLHMIKK
jgi:O-antigen/teichoic acid export membrane protein